MDDFERRTLKQRRTVLAEHVEVDEGLLQALRKANLLTTDMVVIIDNERSNVNRIHKLVDFLLGCQRVTTFTDFCTVLQTSGDASWLAKELQTEVNGDRGNLVLDEDVVKESAMLVHRKFGSSKRFSETDKKEMTELIAIKIQVAKEEWREELKAVQGESRDRKAALSERDKQTREIRQEMLKFITEHEKQLITKSHSMRSTSDTLRESVPDDDLMAIFHENLKFLLKRTHRALKEKQLLMDERAKIEAFLGEQLEPDDRLDNIIVGRLKNATRDVDKLRKDLKSRDEKIERLRSTITKMETELEMKEEEIETLSIQKHERQNEEMPYHPEETDAADGDRASTASSDSRSVSSSNGNGGARLNSRKKPASEKTARKKSATYR